MDSLGRFVLRVGVAGLALSFLSSTALELLFLVGAVSFVMKRNSNESLSGLILAMLWGAETGLLQATKYLRTQAILLLTHSTRS